VKYLTIKDAEVMLRVMEAHLTLIRRLEDRIAKLEGSSR
jgi:hypothetical protein